MIELSLIKYRFYSNVISDILKAIECDALGASFVLSFCCIDYMGVAMQPNKIKNTKQDFIAFINEFMNKINSDYFKYADNLYACRCALIHTYGQSDATKKLNFTPNFTTDTPPFDEHLVYYSLENERKFHVNLSALVSDLIISIELFFETQTATENLLI